MKQALSVVLVAGVLLSAAVVAWVLTYNAGEQLSDRQLINIAAEEAARLERGSVRYENAEKLINGNPTCCIVLHSGHEWIDSQFFGGLSVVQINYIIEKEPKIVYYFKETAIDRMGKVLESRGIETNIPMH
ncbi:MAG: hypothetical protein E5Y12_01790 [Mesorhizobium sp.]|nr:MAG: hypothetical protein E5Y12_01790 [Mesorhizobium sp.]